MLGVALTKLLGFSSRVSPALQQLGMLVVAVEAVAYAVIAVLLGVRRLMPMVLAMALGILCRAAMAGGGVLLLGTSGQPLGVSLQAAWLGDATLISAHGVLAVLCLAFLRPILVPGPPVPAEAEAFGALRPDVSESLADFQTSAVAAPESVAGPEASREELVSELMGPVAETTDAAGAEAPAEPSPVTYLEEPAEPVGPPDVEEPAPSYAAAEPVVPDAPPEPAMEQPQELPVETPALPYADEPTAAPAPTAGVSEEQPTAADGPLFSFEIDDTIPEPADEREPVLRVTSEGVEEIDAEAQGPPRLEEPSAEPAVAEQPPAHVPVPSTPAPELAEPAAAPVEAADVSGEVSVSADTVLAQFPEGALNLAPDQLEEAFAEKRFAVPLDIVLPQLHEGEVRVPARVIVEQLPADALAVSEVELDAALADGIELPLGEIVPQIPGEHLAVSSALAAPPELPTEDIFEVPAAEGFDAVVTAGEAAAPEAPSVEAEEEPEAVAPVEAPPPAAPEPVAPEETIAVDAEMVLGQLPPEVFVTSAEDVHGSLSQPEFRIPADTVMSQLSSGQVVVPTSLIASQLPPGVLATSPEEIDAHLPAGGIELPLSQVVAQVEGHLGLMRDQRPAPVIDDEPLFSPMQAEGPPATIDSSAVVTPSVPPETSEPPVPAEVMEGPPEPEPVEAVPPAPWEAAAEPEPAVAEAPVVGAEEPVQPSVPTESVEAPAESELAEAAPRAPWEAAEEQEVAALPPAEAPPDVEEPVAPEPAIEMLEEEEPVEAETHEAQREAEAAPMAEEAPAAAPAEAEAEVPAPGAEAVPAVAPGSAEALAAIEAAGGRLGASQTDWVESGGGIYFGSALPSGADMQRASEVAANVLAAGRELCDASERGVVNTVLVSARLGCAALGWGVTAGGAPVACQLAGIGIRSPGKVGVAVHKLMRALQSMSLTGDGPAQGSAMASEGWTPSEGDSNGAEEAEKAAAAVKLAGVGGRLFVRGDGPRMILLGPPALLADACVSAAGRLLDSVGDYAASIGLGEVEKVIVEGVTGAAALIPAQDGNPALVLLGPGRVKAGMVSVQIRKAVAALGADVAPGA